MYVIRKKPKKHFLSWQFLVLKLLVLAGMAIWVQPPTGTLEGHIALEKEGFGLYTYDLSKNHVFAMVNGPRGQHEIERGVWINKDGTYRIGQLPVGEYSLKVRAPGFNTVYDSGVWVDEEKVTQVRDIELSALTPTLSIAGNRRVFTTDETPSFWVNASGCGSATVNVYRKNLIDIVDGQTLSPNGFTVNQNLSVSKNYSGTSSNPWAKEKPIASFSRNFAPSFDDSKTENFKLDQPLPPGEYWIDAEGCSVLGGAVGNQVSWFMVSDMGMVIMRAPEKTVVRAIDLKTLKPLQNVEVKRGLWSERTSKYTSKKTDANGFVTFAPINVGLDGRFKNDYPGRDTEFFVGQYGPNLAYDDISLFNPSRDKYTTYIYTERPVYRLGQTVYFKGMVREKTLNGNKNPGNKVNVTFDILDGESTSLQSGTLQTSEHGTFHGLFNIPADAHTGTYSIHLKYDENNQDYGTFAVEEYRKPEYLVEVKPETPRVVAGDKMKARVHATYFFGGPVANAKVKYSVYSSADYSTRYSLKPRPKSASFFDDWDDTSGYSSDYGGEFVCDGEVQTDANGDAQVEFDSAKIDTTDVSAENYKSLFEDKHYKIQAEVTDISRLTVDGSTTELATAGDFELFVTPDSYVASVGEPLGVTVQAMDYDGKPVAGQKIALKVGRMLRDSNTNSYRGVETVADLIATTGTDGTAHTSVKCGQWPSDTFTISATAKDAKRHTIYDDSSIWIANSSTPYVISGPGAASEPVSVKLDKAVYEPGDVAKVMITAPVDGTEGVQAIVSVEGLKLYGYKVIDMTSTAKLVEIPIKKEYAPNAYVSVVIVDAKHQFYSQSELLKVSPDFNFLNITVDSDKKKYHPGESVKYTIKAVTPDGAPAPNTELSLSVVDESIYSIRPDSAPDIRKTFYVKRENNVVTTCSFPEEYSGGPDKDASSPVVRKDFRDIAAWLPVLKTDKNGIAVASIKLPDNLTTWRATVHGIDMETRVGTAMQKVMCTQDLILRLAMPRFFSQGDEGLLTAVVHNYSDITQNVTLTLDTSRNFQTSTPAVQKLTLAPEKAGRISWPVVSAYAGTGVVTVKAVGQKAGDAVQQKIPIRTFGIPAFASNAGMMDQDQQTVTIPAGLTGDAVRETAKFKVNVASSTLGPVLGNFNALIEYPYGCTEQTMSRLVPSMVAMQLHSRLGQPLSKTDRAKFDQVYMKAMEKLTSYHHADGGWGWWESDKSNSYLTALVVNGMKLLKDAGYDIDQSFVTEGCKYLKAQDDKLFSQLSDPKTKQTWWAYEDRNDLAKCMYTLSEFKQAPSKPMTLWFKQQVNDLCPESLSYLALTYHAVNDDATAHLFYDRLVEIANVSKVSMDWQHTEALIRRMKLKSTCEFSDYTYRYTGVETTALGLRSVLAMEPNNTQRIEAIKNWIMLQRGTDGWGNTKTTAEVFLVLLEEELQSRARGATGNFTARISLNEKTVEDFTANAANLYASQKDIPLQVPGKATSLVIEKNGPGRLYYNALMTYFRTMHRGDVVSYKAIPDGLKISRKFYRLATTAKAADGGMHFHAEEITDGHVKAGETILMKVFVESPLQLPYVMVDAALPSGAEVVKSSAEENNIDQSNATPDEAGVKSDTDSNGISGDWGFSWWNHEDVLDDRIVYFGTTLPQGKSEFHTLIRMELPGKFGVNPVSLEGMYTDKVRGYSALNELIVTEEDAK